MQGLGIVGNELAVVVDVLRRGGKAFGLDGTPQGAEGHVGEDIEGNKTEVLFLHFGIVHAQGDAPANGKLYKLFLRSASSAYLHFRMVGIAVWIRSSSGVRYLENRRG